MAGIKWLRKALKLRNRISGNTTEAKDFAFSVKCTICISGTRHLIAF